MSTVDGNRSRGSQLQEKVGWGRHESRYVTKMMTEVSVWNRDKIQRSLGLRH
jgi:hypothetical protein